MSASRAGGENDEPYALPSTPGSGKDKQVKTPSKSSSKDPTLPINIHTVRGSLAERGLRFNDRVSYEEDCSEFKKKIDAFFAKQRSSRMRDESAKAIMKTLSRVSTQNEKTLFGQVRPMVIKTTRTVETKKRGLDGILQNMIKSFKDDGLEVLEDRQFVSALVPGKNYASKEKVVGLTEPKPDVTFGVQEDKRPLPGLQPTRKLKALKCVAPGLEWPFFVIEHKSYETIAAAENQGIRDGAVMVNAQLQMKEMLDPPSNNVRPIGAVDNVFAFSAAWVPDMAKIFVHWVETLQTGHTIFHMNLIRAYVIEREEELADFRRDADNIIDWGLLTYKPAMEAIFNQIMAKGKGKVPSTRPDGCAAIDDDAAIWDLIEREPTG